MIYSLSIQELDPESVVCCLAFDLLLPSVIKAMVSLHTLDNV